MVSRMSVRSSVLCVNVVAYLLTSLIDSESLHMPDFPTKPTSVCLCEPAINNNCNKAITGVVCSFTYSRGLPVFRRKVCCFEFATMGRRRVATNAMMCVFRAPPSASPRVFSCGILFPHTLVCLGVYFSFVFTFLYSYHTYLWL